MKKTVGSLVTDRETYHVDSALSVRDAARYMTERRVGAVAVLEGDRLVGMVSQRDLLQIDLSEKDEEIRWLNAYIHFIPPVREGTS